MTGSTAAFTTTDGVRYGVRRSGQGVPVLLLHGFTGRGADWDAMRPAYQACLSGEATPAEAAARMQERAVRLIAEMRE